jgi:hypothetical protein
MRLERRRRVHRRESEIERGRRGDDDALACRKIDQTPLTDECKQLVDRFLRGRRELASRGMIVEDVAPHVQ